jgi:hypothetical protein
MQGSLFDTDAPTGAYGQPVEPAPARGWATVEEDGRFTGQCLAILTRLRRGSATNGELNAISPRFGARLKELRDGGINIVITDRDRATGRVTYAIAS